MRLTHAQKKFLLHLKAANIPEGFCIFPRDYYQALGFTPRAGNFMVNTLIRYGVLRPVQPAGVRLLPGAYARLEPKKPAPARAKQHRCTRPKSGSEGAHKEALAKAVENRLSGAMPRDLPAAVETACCGRLCPPRGRCPGCGARQDF